MRENIPETGSESGDVPAGWYPMNNQLRWWDGTAWTNEWRKTPERQWTTSAQVGLWLAVLLPPIGFLMGLALVAGKDKHGHWVVLTSVVVPILAVLLLAFR